MKRFASLAMPASKTLLLQKSCVAAPTPIWTRSCAENCRRALCRISATNPCWTPLSNARVASHWSRMRNATATCVRCDNWRVPRAKDARAPWRLTNQARWVYGRFTYVVYGWCTVEVIMLQYSSHLSLLYCELIRKRTLEPRIFECQSQLFGLFGLRKLFNFTQSGKYFIPKIKSKLATK